MLFLGLFAALGALLILIVGLISPKFIWISSRKNTVKIAGGVFAVGLVGIIFGDAPESSEDAESRAAGLVAFKADSIMASVQPIFEAGNYNLFLERVDSYKSAATGRLGEMIEIAESHVDSVAQSNIDLYGEPPTPTLADGYREVEDLLQTVDPEADVEACSSYRVTTEGYLTRCTFTGQNAFGATVRDQADFVIRYGQAVMKN